MSWRNNRDTILSNVAQQFSGALAILVIPKFMAPVEYGKIAVILTLISLVPVADLGLTNVYNRKVPPLLATGQTDEVSAWNATAVQARMVGSLIFGILACAFYYEREGDIAVALLILFLCALSGPTTFFIGRCIATSDFATARNLNLLQSVLRLAAIPGAIVAGVFGWSLGQMLGLAGLFTNRKLWHASWHDTRQAFAWRLARENLIEAIQLVILTNVWLQVLGFARTFAAFGYPNHIIANYSLVSAAYQAVSATLIAAFVPQTVKVYALFGHSRKEAVAYVVRTVMWTIPLVLAGAGVLAAILPDLFAYVFPRYMISRELIYAVVASLAPYPLLLTLGTLLVGSGRSRLYLVLVLGAMATALAAAWLAPSAFGYDRAAFAQLVAVSTLAVTLCFAVAIEFRDCRINLAPLWVAATVGIAIAGTWFFRFVH